jgi:hypothetical protein
MTAIRTSRWLNSVSMPCLISGWVGSLVASRGGPKIKEKTQLDKVRRRGASLLQKDKKRLGRDSISFRTTKRAAASVTGADRTNEPYCVGAMAFFFPSARRLIHGIR